MKLALRAKLMSASRRLGFVQGEIAADQYFRIVNIGLRFATLITRFMLVFFLARYLEPASIGYYGLFTAAVGFSLYFVGLDFYVYVTREIIRSPGDQRGNLLKGQAALAVILYVVGLPAAILILNQAGWPGNLLWWFVPILLLEHFNQEVYRLLIALSEQIAASLLLFVRQGSWAIAAVALMAWDAGSRSLDVVMALWSCAGMAAAILGIIAVRRMRMGGWRKPIDWSRVKKGIAVSTTFLIATLALRGIQTVDRYWLEALGGIEVVGAYVLFVGVAGTLMVFLDAGVFSYAYPKLISLSHAEEHGRAKLEVRQIFFQVIAVVAAFSAVSWFCLPILLDWVGSPVYKDEIFLYPWILVATAINALGMVPHYALYARGVDRPIIYSHVAALPIFVLSTWLFSGAYAVLAVPVGLIIAFTLILTWKTVAYLLIDTRIAARNRSKNNVNL